MNILLDISFDGVRPTIKTDVLTAGVMGIVQGYPAWLAAHPEYAGSVDTAVAAYLADPATQAAMQQIIADSVDFSGMSSQIEQQLRDKLSQQIGQQQLQKTLHAVVCVALRAVRLQHLPDKPDLPGR